MIKQKPSSSRSPRISDRWDRHSGLSSQHQPSASGIARLGLPALLFVVTLALYAPVASHEFLNYDDEDYVTHNLRVQEGLTRRSMWWALTSLDASNWHPLTWLSLQLDAE